MPVQKPPVTEKQAIDNVAKDVGMIASLAAFQEMSRFGTQNDINRFKAIAAKRGKLSLPGHTFKFDTEKLDNTIKVPSTHTNEAQIKAKSAELKELHLKLQATLNTAVNTENAGDGFSRYKSYKEEVHTIKTKIESVQDEITQLLEPDKFSDLTSEIKTCQVGLVQDNPTSKSYHNYKERLETAQEKLDTLKKNSAKSIGFDKYNDELNGQIQAQSTALVQAATQTQQMMAKMFLMARYTSKELKRWYEESNPEVEMSGNLDKAEYIAGIDLSKIPEYKVGKSSMTVVPIKDGNSFQSRLPKLCTDSDRHALAETYLKIALAKGYSTVKFTARDAAFVNIAMDLFEQHGIKFDYERSPTPDKDLNMEFARKIQQGTGSRQSQKKTHRKNLDRAIKKTKGQVDKALDKFEKSPETARNFTEENTTFNTAYHTEYTKLLKDAAESPAPSSPGTTVR